jgi:4-hydroxybenzoate polyprenyltransferase
MIAATIFTTRFGKGYGESIRPHLLFVSGITGIAGLSFAPQLGATKTIALFVVFFFLYGFAQAFINGFRMDRDEPSSSLGSPAEKRIAKRDILIISLLNLLLGGIILGYFAVSSLLLILLCVVGLLTYTFFKRRWWGGPFYNGWIVGVLFLIGYNSGLGATGMILSDPISFALVSVIFGYMNVVLIGYFQDVTADGDTGYNTLPVAIGREFSAVLSDMFAIVFLLTGAASFLLCMQRDNTLTQTVAGTVFLFASVVASVRAQIQLHNVESDEQAAGAISSSVHTYMLMLSAVCSANKPDWIAGLILLYGGFIAASAFRTKRVRV